MLFLVLPLCLSCNEERRATHTHTPSRKWVNQAFSLCQPSFSVKSLLSTLQHFLSDGVYPRTFIHVLRVIRAVYVFGVRDLTSRLLYVQKHVTVFLTAVFCFFFCYFRSDSFPPVLLCLLLSSVSNAQLVHHHLRVTDGVDFIDRTCKEMCCN